MTSSLSWGGGRGWSLKVGGTAVKFQGLSMSDEDPASGSPSLPKRERRHLAQGLTRSGSQSPWEQVQRRERRLQEGQQGGRMMGTARTERGSPPLPVSLEGAPSRWPHSRVTSE